MGTARTCVRFLGLILIGAVMLSPTFGQHDIMMSPKRSAHFTPSPAIGYIRDAQEYLHAGEPDSAILSYGNAVRAAGSDDEFVISAMAANNLLIERAALLGNPPDALAQIDSLYRMALLRKKTRKYHAVRVEYAEFLLRQGRREEADRLLKELAEDRGTAVALKPRDRAQYNQTLGALAESRDDPATAIEMYGKALRSDSTFRPALKALGQASMNAKHETQGIPAFLESVRRGLIGRDYGLVAATLDSALFIAHWQYHWRYPEVVLALVRYYTERELVGSEFERVWKDRLLTLTRTLPTTTPAPAMVSEVVTAYQGELQVTATFDAGVWKAVPDGSTAYSKFLAMLGDSYFDTERSSKAVDYYRGALLADRCNVRAALYLGHLIHEHAEDLDPDTSLSRWLLSVLAEIQTNCEKARGADQKWKLDLLVANLLDQQGEYGLHGDNGAIEFYRRSIDEYRSTTETKQTESAITGVLSDLFLQYGDAYRKAGSEAQAWHVFLEASEGALETNNIESASDLLMKLETVAYPPTAEEAERLRRHREAVRAAEKNPD